MMDFLAEYGLFLLKVITVVAGIIVIIVAAAAAGRKQAHEGLEVENLNKKHESLVDSLRNAISSKDERKQAGKGKKEKRQGGGQRAPDPAT